MYDQQQAAINRQTMIAQALRDSGNIPPSRVGMTASGGLAVPISPFEAATKLFQSGLGAYEGNQAQKATDALSTQRDKDAQGQLQGILDQLTGPSQTAVPPDNTQPPIGATSNFQDASGGAPQAQQPTIPGASLQEQNPRRAAMAAILKNADPQEAVAMLRGPALSTLEPKPDYTLAEGATRISGATGQPVAAGASKTYKPDVADRALVKIIDKSKPEGYSTIKRSDFDPAKMNEYIAPTAAQLAMTSFTPDAMQAAVEYAAVHDSHPPPNMPRNGPIYGEFLDALQKHYKSTGNDVGNAQVVSEQNKSDQASLTNITKLKDNSTQAFGTMDRNLSSLEDAYKKSGDTGTEWGNKLYRMWQTGTGDPDLKPVRAYLAAAQKEYAKLQMNSFGNAMTSDAANADAARVINENFTNGGIQAVIDAMRGEGKNRTNSLDSTYQGIQARLKERSHPEGATGSVVAPPATTIKPGVTSPAASKTPVQIKGDADYAALPSGTVFVGPDGKTRTKP